MAVLKCKMCGGDLAVTEGMKIVTCDFCDTTQTVPNADSEKKTNLFNRANRLRIASEFDRAAGVYETIIAEFPEEAEAYWGLCLCKYGIEYVDDPRTAEKIPTCHRTSFESIFHDINYEMALECADPVARGIYEREAKVIDLLQSDILHIVKQEQPFDVFICYKETDSLGSRTLDSVLAQDIYDYLTDRGFKVFFARITLEDKLGQEYEPYIFAALNSAKVMLVVGTESEHFNAVWVKNEWSRFLSLMHTDRDKTLVPCYRNMDPYDLPAEFRNLQGQDMGKLGFIQDLARGITKIIRGSADVRPAAASSTPSSGLTKRGYIFLEDGEFRNAEESFDKALDENPEDSKAYVGKVLARHRLSGVEELTGISERLLEDKNFERAIRYATGADRAFLEGIRDDVRKKQYAEQLITMLKRQVANVSGADVRAKLEEVLSAGTVEAYGQALAIYEDAYARAVDRKVYSLRAVEQARVRYDIMRTLANGDELTASQIQAGPHFANRTVSLATIEAQIQELVRGGSVESGMARGSYGLPGMAGKRQQQAQERYSWAESMLRSAERTQNPNEFFAASRAFSDVEHYRDALERARDCWRRGMSLQNRVNQVTGSPPPRKSAGDQAHNEQIIKQIHQLQDQMKIHREIYAANEGKIFGEGARRKKLAKEKITELEHIIEKLKGQLR